MIKQLTSPIAFALAVALTGAAAIAPVATYAAQVQVGYADDLRPATFFPTPWSGGAGVALFAGASTVPAMRRRGLQYALLAARMQYAIEKQCDLAMMGALPGSSSQRNAERHGFRIAYTRIKWQRETSNGN